MVFEKKSFKTFKPKVSLFLKGKNGSKTEGYSQGERLEYIHKIENVCKKDDLKSNVSKIPVFFSDREIPKLKMISCLFLNNYEQDLIEQLSFEIFYQSQSESMSSLPNPNLKKTATSVITK